MKTSAWKANEKQQIISRNMNIKNFILNFESINNPNISSNCNFLFKKQNPHMLSKRLSEFPLMSNQNSYSNRVSKIPGLLIQNNSNNISRSKIPMINLNSNKLSKDFGNDSKLKNSVKQQECLINFKNTPIVIKNKNYPLFNTQKSKPYNLKNEIINFSRFPLTSRNEKEFAFIKNFKK